MTDTIISVSLLVAAVAAILVGGIFHAFSSFVMAGLGRIPSEQGANAMRSINVTVFTPSFMIPFMGMVPFSLAIAGWSLFAWDRAGSGLILSGALLYLFGCFGVTMSFNVPLNNRLAAVQSAGEPALWAHYQRAWTRWNTVRTISPTLAGLLFVLALPS